MNVVTRVGLYEFEDKPENVLGSGSFATVFKGKHSRLGTIVAIKRVDLTGRSDRDKKYLNQEVGVMERVNHPNIIRLHYRQVIGRYLYLVLDYCGGGDLQKYLKSQHRERVDEDTARHFMCQFAAALGYLHEKGIVHRDLKPHNLMLNEQSSVAELKVGDFGFARDAEAQMHSVLGSPLYMAPEILTGQQYSSKSDLWSVGCIFYQMLMGKAPWNPRDIAHLRQLAGNNQDALDFPVKISPMCKDLLEGLLRKDASRRTSWEQFFEHEYLRPENLSKSTLLLPDMSPSKPSATSSPSRPRQAAPASPPEKPGLAVPRSMWLQHVFCLYPHGHAATLYLSPKHTVLNLKIYLARLEGVPTEAQLLIDDSGRQLEDHLPLETYFLHKKESPLYFIPLNHLSAPPAKENYPVKDLPFPDAGEMVDPPIDGKASLKDQLRQKHVMFQLRAQRLEELFQNVMARFGVVTTLTLHHEYQEKAYAALMFNHLVKKSFEMSQYLEPCAGLHQKLLPEVTKLNSSLHSLITKLKNTPIAPTLHSLPRAKTLLDLVGESTIRNEFEGLREAWDTVDRDFDSVNSAVNQINQAAKDLVKQTLNDRFVKVMKEGKGALRHHFTTFRLKKNLFDRQLLSLQKEVEPVLSGGVVSDNEINALLNHRGYKSLDDLHSDCRTQDNLSAATLNECVNAKEDAALEILTRLHFVVPILERAVMAQELLTKTLLPKLNSTQELVTKCQNFLSLEDTYQNVISELHRRNAYKLKMTNECAFALRHFSQERATELVRREAFAKSFVDTGALPAALAPSLRRQDTLPEISISFPKIDEDLPEVSAEGLDIDLEDEFSFLSAEDNGERIKALEKEKAELTLQLKRLVEVQASASDPAVAGSRYVQLLLKKLEDAQAALASASSALPSQAPPYDSETKKLLSRLETLEKENATLKEQLEKDILVRRVTEMGFAEDAARDALQRHGNKLEAAVAYLAERM